MLHLTLALLLTIRFCGSNSWDRQPYVSTFGDAPEGTPTAHMKPRNISYNFLVANYVRLSLLPELAQIASLA